MSAFSIHLVSEPDPVEQQTKDSFHCMDKSQPSECVDDRSVCVSV